MHERNFFKRLNETYGNGRNGNGLKRDIFGRRRATTCEVEKAIGINGDDESFNENLVDEYLPDEMDLEVKD